MNYEQLRIEANHKCFVEKGVVIVDVPDNEHVHCWYCEERLYKMDKQDERDYTERT